MSQDKRIFLGTNLKMYKTISQTVDYLTRLQRYVSVIGTERITLFVIPSYTALPAAGKTVDSRLIRLGAQNMAWEDEGPFTGEISPLMLKEVGVEIVELGHSERRHVFMETDAMINRKVCCALRHGLTPLLCVGETEDQKRLDICPEVLRMQLKANLHGVTQDQAARMMIAYEPVWAIGANGIPATEEYAREQHGVIRDMLTELFGSETARAIPLFYGGSVNLGNAAGLQRQENIDGLFIGRSAWDTAQFEKLIQSVLAGV